jgi:hypothetical protein
VTGSVLFTAAIATLRRPMLADAPAADAAPASADAAFAATSRA